MVRAKLVVATLLLLASCGSSAATSVSGSGAAAGGIAPYRVALARCLDAASFDLPDQAVGNVAAIDAASEACDDAAAELRAADLSGALRTVVDALQREFVALDAALDRARTRVDNSNYDDAAKSELLTAIANFQNAASQIL